MFIVNSDKNSHHCFDVWSKISSNQGDKTSKDNKTQ